MLDKRKEALDAPNQAVDNKRGARRVVTKGERIVRVVDTTPIAKKLSSELVAEKLGATPVGNSPKK
jgi:hypothetical protein